MKGVTVENFQILVPIIVWILIHGLFIFFSSEKKSVSSIIGIIIIGIISTIPALAIASYSQDLNNLYITWVVVVISVSLSFLVYYNKYR